MVTQVTLINDKSEAVRNKNFLWKEYLQALLQSEMNY